MSKNLFITATEARSGKSAVCLGILEMLLRKAGRVGFFRPLIEVKNKIKDRDHDVQLFTEYFKISTPYEKMFAYTVQEATTLLGQGRQDELLEGIFHAYQEIEKDHDFVLCEGIEIEGSSASLEFEINAEISNNLGCPVLLVAGAHNKSVEETIRSIGLYQESFREKGCNVISTVVNRINLKDKTNIIKRLKKILPEQLVYAIPNEPTLGKPTMGEIAKILNAEVLYGEDHLNRHVYSFTVAAMQLRHFLTRIKHGTLVIVPGDRSDVTVACLSSVSSTTMPKIAGIMLTGGLKPEKSVCRLIEGFSNMVPILSVKRDTFPSAIMASQVHAGIFPENDRKITRALKLFEKNVNVEELGGRIVSTLSTIMTPKMFEYGLLKKAKAHKQRIVLPEGDDERILRAAEILLQRNIVDIILLGNKEQVMARITELGLQAGLGTVEIMDPQDSVYREDYVHTYYDLRSRKGVTMDMARDIISDVSFYGTMMVYKGDADGMVSGAAHTTQATIRPAFEIIRTKPDISIVSSVFLMCLRDRVLVYGDCAINPDPNARQLAEIAFSSARTAQIFGIEPRVAMLSYSTGESGKGADVEKVRNATQLAREKIQAAGLDLKLEGPIQYDAAVDPQVARIKMPESDVAGRATVFIFPDLNTGNNTYKAVQRSAGAVAIGPVLQGLNRPVNDLSRGCTVADVVNTIAITAVQAQAEKGLL